MNAIVQRRPATPYARRLARERGIDLLALTGTGPNGRIVAADVESYVAPSAQPAPVSLQAAPSPSVFATSIDLSAANGLLANLGGAGVSVDLADMLVRAGAQALELASIVQSGTTLAIALEDGGGKSRRSLRIDDPQVGLMTALHAKIEAQRDAAGAANGGPLHLSIRHLDVAGIRAVSVPLVDGAALRLVVSTGGSDAAEALLAFEADVVGEDIAARLLAAFRDALETPLRLLA